VFVMSEIEDTAVRKENQQFPTAPEKFRNSNYAAPKLCGIRQSCPQPALSRLDPLESGSAAWIGRPTNRITEIVNN